MRYDEEKINRYFQEMGMDEYIERAAEKYSEKYMISGEITDDLGEMLKRASDSLIDIIWDNIEGPDKLKADREKKEQILLQDIPSSLQEELIYLEPERVMLLAQIANQYPIEMIDTMIVNDEFMKKGWVFCFLEDNSCTFNVARQLYQTIMSIKDEEVKGQLGFVYGIRYILNTCLRLYGVFKRDFALDLFKSIVSEDAQSLLPELDGMAEQVLKKLESRQMFWTDRSYIVDNYFESRQDYQQMLDKQKGKQRYTPKDEDILLYADGKWRESGREYQAVLDCLARELQDMESAKDILGDIVQGVVKEGWSIPEIMNQLYQSDVCFNSERNAGRLTRYLSEWLYSVRRWEENGGSRKDNNSVNIEEQYVLDFGINKNAHAKSKKIGRNDPCPCGSGKKYKHCCGK